MLKLLNKQLLGNIDWVMSKWGINSSTWQQSLNPASSICLSTPTKRENLLKGALTLVLKESVHRSREGGILVDFHTNSCYCGFWVYLTCQTWIIQLSSAQKDCSYGFRTNLNSELLLRKRWTATSIVKASLSEIPNINIWIELHDILTLYAAWD